MSGRGDRRALDPDAPGRLAAAAAMRTAFDLAFARPLAVEAPRRDLLAIRCGDRRYALWLHDLTGIAVDRAITRLPGAARAVLGIAGFRGAIVPAYHLELLLGGDPSERPRWLVTLAAAPIALAFDELIHHVRAAPEAIAPHAGHAAGARAWFLEAVRAGDAGYPILHVPAVLDAVGIAAPARTARGAANGAGPREVR